MQSVAKKAHIGRKIERIREIKGIKQETLASELGITQQAVSKIELSETIDEKKLEHIARILGVSVNFIKEFQEEAAIFNIQHNHDNAANNINYQFNPIEKIIELYNDKVALLERLLKEKEEIIEMFKKNQQAS